MLPRIKLKRRKVPRRARSGEDSLWAYVNVRKTLEVIDAVQAEFKDQKSPTKRNKWGMFSVGIRQ